jgi:hypothetical protein
MYRRSFETIADGRAAIPRELANWLRFATLVAVALLLVRGGEAVGLVSQVDTCVEDRQIALAHALGVSRESSDAVIVIAGDRETIAAWGPPPWPWERLDPLLAAIEAGEPDRIVVLGHAPMFDRATSSPRFDLAASIPGFDPAALQVSDVHLRVLGLGGTSTSWAEPAADAGVHALRLGPNATLRELGRVSERVPEVPELLAIRWATPVHRLPVIPAEQVAAGRIPPSTFAGRVVVLGVTDPVHAHPLATPLGPLSPVEIEAHALSGLLDGRVAAGQPRAWSYLGCAALAIVLVFALGRARLGVVVLGASLGLATMFALGFAGTLDWATSGLRFDWATSGPRFDRATSSPGFDWATLELGRPILTVAATLVGFAVAEFGPLGARLRRARARVVHELARDSASADLGWAELAELATHYANAVLGGELATTLLERVGSSARVVVRAGAPSDSSAPEPEPSKTLDLRRAPLRSVWLTARASLSSAVVLAAEPGSRLGPRKTLIVPLAEAGVLVGVWLIHLPERATPSADAVARCERLGRQLAAAIVRRRLREGLDPLDIDRRRPSLTAELALIEAGLTRLRDEQRWALELLEQLPVHAAIATVWGELEFVDPRLREALERRCPGLFVAQGAPPNLVDILARLTGTGRAEARAWMQAVVRDGVTHELAAIPPQPATPAPRWLLAPLELSADRPELGPSVEHLLLIMIPPAPAGPGPGPGPGTTTTTKRGHT